PLAVFLPWCPGPYQEAFPTWVVRDVTRGKAHRCAARAFSGACGLAAARALWPAARRRHPIRPTLQQEERSRHLMAIAFPPSALHAGTWGLRWWGAEERLIPAAALYSPSFCRGLEETATAMPAAVKTEICTGTVGSVRASPVSNPKHSCRRLSTTARRAMQACGLVPVCPGHALHSHRPP